MAGHRGSSTQLHGASGAMRRSGPIAGGTLSPLQGDEDAPVSKWMEDAAMSRAQAVRHGSDDWEPQLGDGSKGNARDSTQSGDRSPRFEMASIDGIMARARDMSSGALPPGPGKGREVPRAHSTSPAASSLIDPPSRASTAASAAWGQPSVGAAAAEVPPPAMRQRPVARSRAEYSALGKSSVVDAQRSSTASTSDSLGGIRTKDGGIWPQRSAPELASYGIQGAGAGSSPAAYPSVLSDGRPVPPMPLPMDQRGRTSPISSPQRIAPAVSAVSPSQSTGGVAEHSSKPAGPTVSSIPTRDIVQQDARAMLNHLQSCPGGVNATDAAGWACLHWAAMDGKEEHVAALLDSGAEASTLTTQPIDDDKVSSGVREAGTSAATLARFPAEGAKGHSRVVKLISAAERGAFRLRREHKQRGDAAMNNGDFGKAVEEYERVLGAVLQLEDTEAMTVRSALNMAEEAVQRQEEEALKAAEAERQAARRKREEEEAAEEQKRAQNELANRTLREAEAALTDEVEQDHVSQALQTIEPLMEEGHCAGDLRDFLWRVASRLQGQLRVSEARSTQRAEELADIEVAKSSLNLELGTARGEVEALHQVVVQRAEEAETLKRSRAEASEALTRLEKETARVREDCTKQLESSQQREETLLAERRAQDAALEELRDTVDDLRVQLTTANAQLSSIEEDASNQRVGLQSSVSAKEAELSAAMSVNATLESKVEEALAGAEKALEQAAVWQAKAEEEAKATEAVKRELVAAGVARTQADEDALAAQEELKREHEASLQKQLYVAASAKDEHDAMIDEIQSAAAQRAEEAAQRLAAAEQVTENVRMELAEQVAARAADKVAAEQAMEAQAAVAATAQDEIKAAGALAFRTKEAEMVKAREEAIDALTKCKMERDSAEVGLADAQKQLETHREEAAETLRKLADAEAGFTDERAKLVKAVQDAEQAAIEAKEDGERNNTELKEQAGWRETLRKKVEERCVKLEATVASFTTNNTELTQQLATTSTSLAKAESRASEAEETTAAMEAEVGAAHALVAEAEKAVADLKKAAAAEVKAARQGRTAMADQLEQLQGELAAATSKVGEGWSQQVATSAAVEEVKAELRTCKESLGSRELELEQAKEALTKADAARAKLRSAHEVELKEIAAEGAAKATTLLSEIAELRTKLEASRQAAAEASEATSAKDAELDSTAVARAAAELRAKQRGETIAEQTEALAEASKEAQDVAKKAVEELSVVMAARQAAERDAEALRAEAASLVDARRVAEETADSATKEARAAVEARRDAERREAAAKAREDALEGRLTELEQAWKDDLNRVAREKAALTDIILGKQGCPTLEELQAEAAEAAAANKKLKEQKAEKQRKKEGGGASSVPGRGGSSREGRDRAGGREEQHDRKVVSKGKTGASAASATDAAGTSGRRDRIGRRAARPVSSSSSDSG